MIHSINWSFRFWIMDYNIHPELRSRVHCWVALYTRTQIIEKIWWFGCIAETRAFWILSFAAAAQAASATAKNLKRVMRAYAQQTTRPLSTMDTSINTKWFQTLVRHFEAWITICAMWFITCFNSTGTIIINTLQLSKYNRIFNHNYTLCIKFCTQNSSKQHCIDLIIKVTELQ